MKILVPVKRVIDPHITVRINEDGLDVVRHNVPHAMNPFDEVALAKGADLRTNGVARELVAVSIGPDKAAETLRTALAMGADRAIHILCDAPSLPSFTIARILQKIYEDEGPDLVLLGKQAVDSDAAQTAALLAVFLDLPFLPDSAALDIDPAANTVTTRFDLNGSEMTAKAPLPAVASCELHLFTPRPVSLPQLMKARQKRIAVTRLDELELAPLPPAPALSLREPAPRPPCRLFETVDELTAQLKTDGLVK